MSEGGAKTLVFVSGGVLIGLALLSGKGDTYKRVWAAGLWTTALAVVADVSPQVVGYFSIAVIVGAVAVNEGVLGGFLAGGQAAAVTPSKGSTSPTADAASRGGAARSQIQTG